MEGVPPEPDNLGGQPHAAHPPAAGAAQAVGADPVPAGAANAAVGAPAGAAPVLVAGPPVTPQLEPTRLYRFPYDTAVRAGMAFTFVVILFVTIVWAFVLAQGHAWNNVKDLLQLLLPAETALLGSAVGFYFGTRSDPK